MCSLPAGLFYKIWYTYKVNKYCKHCSNKLTIENTSKAYKSLCKTCYSQYMKQYYIKNPDKYNRHKDELVKNNDKAWMEKTNSVMLLRMSHGCIDCGELDPIVLEFDHRNPSTKKYKISDIRKTKVKIEDFISELEKCDVVCANCHRRRTAKQFGSWRAALA